MDTIEKQSRNCHREMKDTDKLSWHLKKDHLWVHFAFWASKSALPLPCLSPGL